MLTALCITLTFLIIAIITHKLLQATLPASSISSKSWDNHSQIPKPKFKKIVNKVLH